MDVVIKLHSDPAETAGLQAALDQYALQVASEYRDTAPPSGVGARLLESAHGSPLGRVMTAHSEGVSERLGMCVTVPLEDPLTGDSLPMIVVLEVHPEWRHRGLARRMVQTLTEELRSCGHPDLAARAGHNDDALISMGERMGFVRSWELMVRESE